MSGNDIRRYAACSRDRAKTHGSERVSFRPALLANGERCEISRGSHRTAETSTVKKGPDLKLTRRGISTAWKSRVLPAGDDRQEEASKRAGVPGKSHHGQSHTMMIYPLVSCGRSLKTVPWMKRCNRLPLLKSGANLSALSSERVCSIIRERRHRRCRFFQEDPLIFGINPINS